MGGNVSRCIFLQSTRESATLILHFNNQPWYLATFAVAEQLYDAMAVWNSEESLTITPLSQPFFAQFDSSAAPGTYSSSSSEFSKFTQAVKELADSYVALAANYTPSDGGLAEQYDRNSGSALSAVDLTWSYASAITAFEARNGSNSKFASWGASGLKVPQTCATQSGGDGRTVEVTFKVTALTIEGGELEGLIFCVDEYVLMRSFHRKHIHNRFR